MALSLSVDCPKITEDKSSESRVQTLGARLTIATRAAPRSEGWNPLPNIAIITKTKSLKAASQQHCSTKTRGSKPASLFHRNDQDAEPEARVSHKTWRKTWSSHFNQMWSLGITSMAKREAWIPCFNYRGTLRLCYNRPHYWVNYCPRNEGVNLIIEHF